jgi:hypothetical protein
MFEQPPVGMTTQEIFTHRDEEGKIRYVIRGKVVDLHSEEIQKPSKKWMVRQGETSFHMGEEEDPLAGVRRRLDLPLRQPPRPRSQQAVGHEPF